MYPSYTGTPGFFVSSLCGCRWSSSLRRGAILWGGLLLGMMALSACETVPIEEVGLEEPVPAEPTLPPSEPSLPFSLQSEETQAIVQNFTATMLPKMAVTHQNAEGTVTYSLGAVSPFVDWFAVSIDGELHLAPEKLALYDDLGSTDLGEGKPVFVTVVATDNGRNDGNTSVVQLTIFVLAERPQIVFDATQAATLPEDAAAGEEALPAFTASVEAITSIPVRFSTEDALFAISEGGVLSLREGQNLNFEAASEHLVELQIDAAGAETLTTQIAVELIDVPDQQFTPLQISVTLPEDADAQTIAEPRGIVVASTDQVPIFYSSEDALFAISPEGFVTLQEGQTLDYESSSTHSLFVDLRTEDGSSESIQILVLLRDVPDQTFIALNDSVTLPEDADHTTSSVPARISARSNDDLAINYSSDDLLFAVAFDGTVSLREGSYLDYEYSPTYTFMATVTASDGSIGQLPITVNVTDVADLSFAAVVNAVSLPEDATPTTTSTPAQVSAMALGATPVLTYASYDPLFDVQADGTVQLRAGQALNYEQASSHTFSVNVHADEGSTGTIEVAVTVTDVADQIFTAVVDDVALPEDATSSTTASPAAIVFSASDGLAVTYSSTDSRFAVSASGQVTLLPGQTLDHETADAVLFDVLLAAPDGSMDTQEVTVTVLDVPDHSFVIGIAEVTLPEDASPSTVAVPPAVTATAVGGLTTLTYATDDALFDVDATSGAVTVRVADTLDHETVPAYTVDVTVAVADGSTTTFPVTVRVADVQHGTAAEPYTIDTLAELQSVAIGFQNELLAVPLDLTASLAAHYLLQANIDASGTAAEDYASGYVDSDSGVADEGQGFYPIGTIDEPFEGNFDGQNWEIRELKIAREVDNLGLFGWVSILGEVRRVSVQDAWVEGEYRVGVLVGGNYGVIEDSQVSGSVSGSDAVGGAVGGNWGRLQRLRVQASVQGESVVGGVVGGLWSGAEAVYALRSFSTVRGELDRVGGVVGYANADSSGQHADLFSAALVEGRRQVGGVFGLNRSQPLGHVVQVGSVYGEDDVGGVLGSSEGPLLQGVFSGGVVFGKEEVGGLIGYVSLAQLALSHSFASPAVYGKTEVHGLIAPLRIAATMDHLLVTARVHGDESVSGFSSLSRSAITVSTFENGLSLSRVEDDRGVGALFSKLQEEVTVSKVYWVPEVYEGEAPPPIAENEDSTGSNVDSLSALTLTEVGELSCSGANAAFFTWDHDGDADTPKQTCASLDADLQAQFPWDFGASGEMPVLRQNGIPVAGQRSFIDHRQAGGFDALSTEANQAGDTLTLSVALTPVDSGASGLQAYYVAPEGVTPDANTSTVMLANLDHVAFFWNPPPAWIDFSGRDDDPATLAAADLGASSIALAVPWGVWRVLLTVVEFNAPSGAHTASDGSAVRPLRVYSGDFPVWVRGVAAGETVRVMPPASWYYPYVSSSWTWSGVDIAAAPLPVDADAAPTDGTVLSGVIYESGSVVPTFVVPETAAVGSVFTLGYQVEGKSDSMEIIVR